MTFGEPLSAIELVDSYFLCWFAAHSTILAFSTIFHGFRDSGRAGYSSRHPLVGYHSLVGSQCIFSVDQFPQVFFSSMHISPTEIAHQLYGFALKKNRRWKTRGGFSFTLMTRLPVVCINHISNPQEGLRNAFTVKRATRSSILFFFLAFSDSLRVDGRLTNVGWLVAQIPSFFQKKMYHAYIRFRSPAPACSRFAFVSFCPTLPTNTFIFVTQIIKPRFPGREAQAPRVLANPTKQLRNALHPRAPQVQHVPQPQTRLVVVPYPAVVPSSVW
ncbi:hypothetical protein FB451DRAFT_459931 [Mycena latifolia]|nr:hypothetical protein FB451DRAFT_459931 [Mycena latifolia]